jgi:hypothetical protein
MRINLHGLIGLAAIVGLVTIAVSRGGSYIPWGATLIVIYGAALLILVEELKGINVSDRWEAPKAGAVSIHLIALHISAAVLVVSFFLGLPNEPAILLFLTPLVAILIFALVGFILSATYEGIRFDAPRSVAVVPPLVLVSMAVAQGWNPIWYPGAALLAYSGLLRMRASRQREAMFDRAELGAYCALVLASLGLLIDVSHSRVPSGLSNATKDVYVFLLQACIFVGSGVAGWVLPFLLLRRSIDP